MSSVLGIPYAKFYSWIKHSLIDFSSSESMLKLHENDLIIEVNGREKTIFVPIFKPEIFQEHIAIDEKHINGQFYTVVSNARTGKTGILCSTIRPQELAIILKKVPVKIIEKVKNITLDMSPSFELVVKQNFPKAIQIVDKFHVIKNGIESLQAIRIRLKQEALKSQKDEQIQHLTLYNESKDKQFIGPKLIIKKTYCPKRLSNGETLPELLSRSKYLCVIHPKKWSEWQRKRANLLFKQYPNLAQAFDAIKDFREWYTAKDERNEPFENERTLGNWLEKEEFNPYQEIKNFVHLVEHHEKRIMNYHIHGHKTNAIAESINAKIMNAIRQNNGARDLDFFHTRLAMII